MEKTVRARFSKGIIEPLEELDIPEGKEVMVTIIEVPLKAKEGAFERAAGAWKGTLDTDKLIKDIYEDRLLSTREEPKL